MIECEYTTNLTNSHYCKKKAEYIINWAERPRPLVVPFNDQNFVCEEHYNEIKKICKELGLGKLEVYKLNEVGEKVKVQFT